MAIILQFSTNDIETIEEHQSSTCRCSKRLINGVHILCLYAMRPQLHSAVSHQRGTNLSIIAFFPINASIHQCRLLQLRIATPPDRHLNPRGNGPPLINVERADCGAV